MTTNIAPDRYKCVRINTEKYKIKGFQTISMCSLKYHDNTIKRKWRDDNMMENGPPVVDYKNNDILKNMYCAISNNVFDYILTDIPFYNAKMSADEMNQFQNLTKTSKLSFLFTNAVYELIPPKGVKLRKCVAEIMENNHPLCKTYDNPIVQMDGRRLDANRNSFCISSNERLPEVQCFPYLLNSVWQSNDVHSLSVIFSFREPKSYVNDDYSCKEWSIEVERSHMCTHLETYLNFEIHLVYYVILTKNYTDEELIRLGLITILLLSVMNFTQFTRRTVIAVSESKTMLRVNVILTVLKKVFHHEKCLIENSFHERKTSIIIRRNDTESIFRVETERILY
ncbi:Hypothetical predicted protein [Mytilus galloprovincialis]|uniref:Uncharacterized protein n=1 Tax=Mytilus galloprovincialis TaxID=29158 RepID=A0A8B6GF70_MYTGA|nr:Hypothetical predicted protein [Mytilus galloprovincialis]